MSISIGGNVSPAISVETSAQVTVTSSTAEGEVLSGAATNI